eukprot:TRINITY_DN6959_c0_g1_i1.p1 TRINITY_DN6959_c0_g1~~TRINITY_DN6959_c0_g1_i1.p1  ORF type:complete len:378 (+),score=41.04 TRINITY_DN6959_c0_g1_i1:72-1205(+)
MNLEPELADPRPENENPYRREVKTICDQYETLQFMDNSVGRLKKGSLELINGQEPVMCTVSCHEFKMLGFLFFHKKGSRIKHASPVPTEIIALRYALAETIDDRAFIIHTPIGPYHFKSPHATALFEWFGALRLASFRSVPLEQLLRLEHYINHLLRLPDSESSRDTKISPYLIYNRGGKQKSFTLVDELTIIGRCGVDGPTLTKRGDQLLSILDSCVSREHGKIIYQYKKSCTYVDLGSSRGTKINGQRAHRKLLEAGDRIRIGHVTIYYEVCGKVGGDEVELKSGWMLKKSSLLFSFTYQNRYFVLKEQRLYYKEHINDDMIRGVIDLVGINIEKHGTNGFVIKSNDVNYQFRTSSSVEAEEWMDAIANAAREVS